MSERIRYRHVNETTLDSYQVFRHPDNGAQYIVRLSIGQACEWFILDEETEVVAVSGSHIRINKAKIQVREALNSLGIVLTTERRKPRAIRKTG